MDQIKKMQKNDCLKRIRELKEILKNSRFAVDTELLKKSSICKQTKKEIARLNTHLSELCEKGKKIVK